MEFDEMKKIWDAQSNAPLYTFSEQALHQRIQTKKNQANHITNFSELLWIVVNLVGGCFVLMLTFLSHGQNLAMYCMALWMIGTAVYMIVSRIHRLQSSDRFDRSLYGDLAHALSVATYQVRISKLGQWNILPLGFFVILGVWDTGKSWWWLAGFLIFFGLVGYFSRWEHGYYEKRERELQQLQRTLESEN
jgi:hypothetical protein